MTDPTAAGAAINNNQHTCPHCGYCPTCGRAYPYPPFFPYIPPVIPWQQPFTWINGAMDAPQNAVYTIYNFRA